MSLRVLKFGGTSLASPGALDAAIARVTETAGGHRVVVVVSAFAGVTDGIADALRQAAAHDDRYRTMLGALRQRSAALLAHVGSGREARRAEAQCAERLQRLGALLDAVALLRRCPAEVHDEALSLGERLAAPVFAAGLATAGIAAEVIDAAAIVRTDSSFGEGRVDLERTAGAARSRLPGAVVAVVPGFFGADPAGRTVLLGRGASDTTATLLGAALAAERIEIWTDVDGVFTGDPQRIPEAAVLPAVSYGDAALAALFGAKVLHHRAIAPAAAARVPIVVRNSFQPQRAGTWIDDHGTPCGFTVAVTADVAMLSLASAAADSAPTSALVEAAAVARVPVLMAQQQQMAESWIAVPGHAGDRLADVLGRDDLLRRGDLAVVAAVGGGVRGRSPALCRRLDEAGVEPVALHCGPGSAAFVMLVRTSAAQLAAQVLHRELTLGAGAAPATHRQAFAAV